MCCAVLQIITIICVTHVKKNLKFELQVTDKISNFHDIAPNFTFSQKLQFFKYICDFLDQPLHPYKFYGRDMSGILFFIFASCEPLTENGLSRNKMLSHNYIFVSHYVQNCPNFTSSQKSYFLKVQLVIDIYKFYGNDI